MARKRTWISSRREAFRKPVDILYCLGIFFGDIVCIMFLYSSHAGKEELAFMVRDLRQQASSIRHGEHFWLQG